jgi:hypothetical protein
MQDVIASHELAIRENWRLADKTAVVTGGTQGIGLATVPFDSGPFFRELSLFSFWSPSCSCSGGVEAGES